MEQHGKDTVYSRIVDPELTETLADFGAVSIVGPKWCGTTRTALEVAGSHIYIDINQAMLDAISVDPYIVLQGDAPRLINEWQIASLLWDAVRHAVDEGGACLVTVSGLKINNKSEVPNAGGLSLGSLYAIGNCSGSMFTGTYPHHLSGISHSRCITFGYLAGKRLAGKID